VSDSLYAGGLYRFFLGGVWDGRTDIRIVFWGGALGWSNTGHSPSEVFFSGVSFVGGKV